MNVSWWNIHPFVFTQSLFSFQGTTLREFPSSQKDGGLKWTRTTDLALIRRAL